MNFIFLFGKFINLDNVNEIDLDYIEKKTTIMYRDGSTSIISRLTPQQVTSVADKIAKKLSIKDGE